MTTTISRLYANKADADAALDDLAERGFVPEQIFAVGPPAQKSDSAAVVDKVANTIAKGRILHRHAVEYAKKVSQGAYFVTVYAPWGEGKKATMALDRHRPVESGVPSSVKRPPKWDEAAPISSALWLPVRSSNATPFGAITGLPTIVSPREPAADLLRRSPNPLSAVLNLPVLAFNAPLSAWLHLPVLTSGAPISTKLGLKTLLPSPAPLSGLLHLPAVSKNGSTVSARFGLRLLW